MEEQLKAMLEGINALKSSQDELKERMQKLEDLEKKLLACGKTKNENKFVSSSPIPSPASPVSVKLYTYDGETNWEVYKIQFCIISEANGWTEGVKACQLVASLRGEATEVLQTLPDTDLPNFNSLFDALDLRFGQKHSKDYIRLQMKTRHQKPEESLQEYANEIQRLTTLAFLDFSANVREMISFEYFVDCLKDGEIQKSVRMAEV
ncbi:uncharacterized protein TNCV_2804271 [Trichonephila clavipes]|nr:uncharacterized protein TNCV_2804271 [Trichonephila clavipes]